MIKEHSLRYIIAAWILTFALIEVSLFAQDDKNILMRKGWEVGVSFTQWGTAFNFLKRWAKTYDKWHGWGVALHIVKHPREEKVEPIAGARCGPVSIKPYVFGKAYNVIALSLFGVRDKMLFDEAPINGVQVWLRLKGGVVAALQKPYYLIAISLRGDTACSYFYVDYQDPDFYRQDRIVSRASFWKGFDKLYFRPGVLMSMGLAFRWAPVTQKRVYQIEAGIRMYYFYEGIRIMVVPDNSIRFMPTTYLALSIGFQKTY